MLRKVYEDLGYSLLDEGTLMQKGLKREGPNN